MLDDCHMQETLCAKDQWYNSLHQMNFDYIPKVIIFGELAPGHQLVSYPALRGYLQETLETNRHGFR